METNPDNKRVNSFYWLYLHPYVHVSIKKDRAILYNSLNARLLEYKGNPQILKLIKRLNSNKNLYVIRLLPKNVDRDISRFIRELKRDFCGDLVESSFSTGKPAQFKPGLCLQKGVDLFLTLSSRDKIRILKKDTLKDYLEVMHLYVNDRCHLDCRICQKAFKQFPYCFKTAQKQELSVREIKGVLDSAKGSRLKKIDILGGNIFKHSEYFQLVDLLNGKKNLVKEYFVHYLNIPGQKRCLEAQDNKSSRVKLLIDFPLKEDRLNEALTLLKQSAKDFVYQFVVEEEADVGKVEQVISENKIENFNLSPYYNGYNTSFFKENIFVDRENIAASSPSMQDIFIRTTLNRYSLGNITIFSNKEVYANVNNPKLGKLGEKDLFFLIAGELHGGRSWAKVRKNVAPCKSCVFNALCPPITNYEYAFGFYNLCSIWQKEFAA